MSVYAIQEGVLVERQVVVPVRIQLIFSLLLIVALTAKIWIKSEAVQVGYNLATARQNAIELDMKRRELELQRSVILRPDNLRSVAVSRLGLSELNPQQAVKVIYVN